MTFKFKHLIFETEETYKDDDVPSWLLSKEYLWFYTGYVVPLKVGESVETDFQCITRIE